MFFRLSIELGTRENESGYFGMLHFVIMYISKDFVSISFHHFRAFVVSVTYRKLYTVLSTWFGCGAE